MLTLIIIQLILAILLVILVLLQGSDNEGLGLGGGGGGLGGMMSARGSANLLSRLTALTATLFMVMSVILTIVASFSSAVFGSSDISVTSFDWPGEEAVAVAFLVRGCKIEQ